MCVRRYVHMLMARVEKDQCIYFAIGLPSFCRCYYLLSADACIHIRLLILRVESFDGK